MDNTFCCKFCNSVYYFRLDNDGSISKITFNNQARDSHLDIPASKVPEFYQAMKLLDDLLYEHAYTFKMENGKTNMKHYGGEHP